MSGKNKVATGFGGVVTYVVVLAWECVTSIAAGRLLGLGLLCTPLGGPLVVLGWYALAMGPISSLPEGRIKSAVASLGSATMGIYLLHMPVLAGLGGLWAPTSFGGRLLFAVAVLTVSWALTEVIRRVPGINRLVAL